MWARLIKLPVKPGTETQVNGLVAQLRATAQPEFFDLEIMDEITTP